jgi:hypothetical protein
MSNGERIEWEELRKIGLGCEWFYMIAEKIEQGWKFYERSTNEVRWFEISPAQVLAERPQIHSYRCADRRMSGGLLPLFADVGTGRTAGEGQALLRSLVESSLAMPEARPPPRERPRASLEVVGGAARNGRH